jgi:hypothetical protein
MGIRQKIQDNVKLGVGMGAILVVVALGFIGMQLQGSRTHLVDAPAQWFYTDDNGKTFFLEDANKIVPFDHNGKQAYRCDVFEGPDGTRFVGLIYRHNSSGRMEMQDYIARKLYENDVDALIRQGIEGRGSDVKRAGADDRSWSRNDEQKNEYLRSAMKTSSGQAAKMVYP